MNDRHWKIIVMANGGLGNRLRALVSGLYISDRFGSPLLLCWMPDRLCGCEFNDLFDNNIELVVKPKNSSRKDFYEKLVDGPIHYYGREAERDPDLASVASIPARETDLNHQGHIVYDCVRFLNFIDRPTRTRLLHQLRIKDNILSNVDEFCTQHRINRNTYGVHIRRTDHAKRADAYFVTRMNAILWKDPTARFFVCSDSKEAETEFARKFPGLVVIKPKKSYVASHMKHQEWRTELGEEEYFYNVSRDRESVIEALEDLIVLSRTNFSIMSNGSFSEIVELMDPGFEHSIRAWDKYGSNSKGKMKIAPRIRSTILKWTHSRLEK